MNTIANSHFLVLGEIIKKYEYNEQKTGSINQLVTVIKTKLNYLKENKKFRTKKEIFENAQYHILKLVVPKKLINFN